MSMTRGEEEKQQQEQRDSAESSSSSSLSSTNNSISLIKLDELSSFGATKQSRLPALIKLNPLADQNSREQQQQHEQDQQATGASSSNSMPDFSGSQVEKMAVASTSAPGGATEQPGQQSLPVGLQQALQDKENTVRAAGTSSSLQAATATLQAEDHDFQVVEMDQMNTMEAQMVGPSLPQQVGAAGDGDSQQQQQQPELQPQQPKQGAEPLAERSLAAASLLSQRGEQYASHLGDSLIEMIINLRNENQNLVKALEVNNGYVKERLDEFKRCQEEAKRRDSEHQQEKAELEHNLRKLQRQNAVLSERLKSMEVKLKEMKLEVSGTLSAAHSSKASSVQGDGEQQAGNLYPQLNPDSDSFGNAALQNAASNEAATMQMDATSGELYNDGDQQTMPSAMDTDQQQQTAAKEVAGMSRDELSRRFDAKKVDFYALDDPMKQCDQLEQQLNDIGKRDYEICLLQQQLNIYRQDFRLERMAKLEAKIQIEKLKNDIDRLCLERLGQVEGEQQADDGQQQHQAGGGENLIGKLGHHLSRKALKSAAKAAKYASKQAHLEEKAAAALARAAAAKASAASHFAPAPPPTAAAASSSAEVAAQAEQAAHGPAHQHGRRHRPHHNHHHHHHHAPPHPAHHRHSAGRSIRGEIVSDLMSTANKAMLTGYNLASTTINSALDKLSQFEQQQAAQATDPNRPRPGVSYPTPGGAQQQQPGGARPSAPPMESHLSVD